MSTRIQFRRGTTATWESTNPVLHTGELGLDTVLRRFKVGDGSTEWNDLEFLEAGPFTDGVLDEEALPEEIEAILIPAKGTVGEMNSYVGSEGEIVSDGQRVRLMDGATPGGIKIANFSDLGVGNNALTFLLEDGVVGGYNITEVPNDWQKNNSDVSFVIIGNQVESIGSWAFYANSLTSVVIPNSVVSLGDYSFFYNQITTVVIGSGVTTIGNFAFDSNSIANLTLGKNVTHIGNYAFFGGSLTSLVIPNSVTSIGDYAFSAHELSNLTLGNSVTTVGSHAFSSNEITSVTIPVSVTSIGAYAFLGNPITNVIIEDGRTSIPESFAEDADFSGMITIPNSVTSIGNAAFISNNLSGVTIGSGVATIGSNAFSHNTNLNTANIYITKTIIDAATDIFEITANPLTIHARVSDATWTEGTGLTVGGNTNVIVIKDL